MVERFYYGTLHLLSAVWSGEWLSLNWECALFISLPSLAPPELAGLGTQKGGNSAKDGVITDTLVGELSLVSI